MGDKSALYSLPAIVALSLLTVLPLEASSKTVQTQSGALKPAVQLLSFEANLGQADPEVKFLSRGRGYTLFLTSKEAVLLLTKPLTGSVQPSTKSENTDSPFKSVVRMKLIGANPSPDVAGVNQKPSKSHYFVGNNPKNWHTNITNYSKVRYQNVYPGVDLLFYGNDRQLEYDFIVAPGVDPNVINLAFEGADQLEIDDDGNLILHIDGRHVLQRRPLVYQEIDGQKKQIPGGYVLNSEGFKNPIVGFQIAGYDASRPLIIDPVLAYSTYVGGLAADLGSSIAIDSVGNIYVTGQTDSPNFPTANARQPENGGSSDAFVLKLDPTGSTLLYSTYLGGSLADRGNSIATDGEGNAYITGRAGSLDFPVTPGAFQIGFRGGMFDAFVAKLSSDGSVLLYSTYLGGFANDTGFGIAVDSGGNAHVAGGTMSDDFPVTADALQPIPGGSTDAYITKLNVTGSGLIYSTYLGGGGNDRANSIALNLNGDAYVTGHTESTDFPTANAYQANNGGGRDAFVAKLNAAGNGLIYSTYLGGTSEDSGLGIAVDFDGNAYITGHTDSTDFPTANAYQSNNGGGRDAFVTKLTSAGSLTYSTYLGGSNSENLVAMGATVGAIAVDTAANAYVTGVTRSVDFPTVNAVQQAFGGGLDDAFVAKITADGSGLLYSTYLGGSASDIGVGIAVDAGGNAYVTGETRSVNFPTTNPFQPNLGGSSDVFITAIFDTSGGTTTLSVSPTDAVPGSTVTVSWTGIPSPAPSDWIGLYLQGTDDLQLLDWSYVSCSQVPGSAQASGSCSFVIPSNLTDGTYEFRLFGNDGGTRLATSNSLTIGGGTTALTVSPTSVALGSTVIVTWSGIPSPAPSDWIGLYLQGTDDLQLLDWSYVSCSQVPGSAQASGSCSFVIPSNLTDGIYEFRLFGNDGGTRLATSNSLTIGGGTTALTVSPTSVALGSTVTVTWSGIPSPTASDWIGLYLQSTDDLQFLAWIYVSCSQVPGSAQANGSCSFVIPSNLTDGTYEFRLFGNDGGTRLATSNPFTLSAV